ncbi:hypothetical protein SGPA1_60083 [Streptomyces misionensis JCM 4497]
MAGPGSGVAAAFAAARVRIDVLCMSPMTLTPGVGEQPRLIPSGELKPAKIGARVPLPGRRIGPAFPAPADADDGGLPHERRRAVHNSGAARCHRGQLGTLGSQPRWGSAHLVSLDKQLHDNCPWMEVSCSVWL